MKWMILFILIIGLAYNYRPTREMHEAKIFKTIITKHNLSEKTWLDWDDLEFKDYWFMTATQSIEKQKIVSYGFFKKVYVSDSDWTRDTTINVDK